MDRSEPDSNLRVHRNFEKLFLLDLKLPTSLYIIIFFLLSLAITGYSVYHGNQALQIPLVHFLKDRSLYPNDPFAATLPYYSSMLWGVVALISRIVPLEPLLLILFLLERLFVIYAAGHLARTFVPKSQLAVVGAMALFALDLNPILGAGTIITHNFEQTGLSIPFFLLATAAFFKSRPLMWAVWTGIGFNLNSMYGTYAMTYFVAVFLLDNNYKKEWQKWLKAFGLFLVIASPAIFFTLIAFGRSTTDTNLWLIASKVRLPHHLYPLTWDKAVFFRFGMLIFIVVAVLHQNRQKRWQLFKHATIWGGVSVLWLIYAFVAAYVAKSPSMIVMHPGRGADLWYCFAGIALTSTCAAQLEETKGWQRRSLFAIMFSASLLIWHPIVGPYLLAICLLLLVWHPVWYYLLGNGNSNRIAIALTVFVLFTALGNFHERFSATHSLPGAFYSRPAPSIMQLADWAIANTTKEKVFLVNPGWDYFRGIAQRPAFVTWKDGSAILWDRSYVPSWVERLQALGLDITKLGLDEDKAMEKLKNIYKNLSDEDTKRLKSRFPLDYWVVPVGKTSSFPIVFENKHYKVLELK